MAATFEISRGTSLSFVIATTSDTPHSGESIDANAFFTDCDLQEYWNCGKIRADNYVQLYNQADTPMIQFEYDPDTVGTPGAFVDLETDEGAFERVVATTPQTNNIFESTFDFTGITGCYRAKIYGVLIDTALSICADNGTFEANDTGFATAVGNAKARTSSIPAQGGTFCESIQANGTPDETHALIGYCSGLASLAADTWYYLTAYVQELSTGTTFTASGQVVGFDLSDFSDANIYLQTNFDPLTDAQDAWHQISVWFKTGSDVTGDVKISQLAGTPNAGGFIFLDTMVFQFASTAEGVLLATSQTVNIQESHACTLPIEYMGGPDQFGMAYSQSSGGSGALLNMIRIEAGFQQYSMKDTLFQEDANSEGQARTLTSRLAKIRNLRTGFMPEFMLEKLAMALKHTLCKINGVEYQAYFSDIEAEWADEKYTAFVRCEAEMRLRIYDYQKSLC